MEEAIAEIIPNNVLPDDLLHYFLNHHLSDRDCLALALSGALSNQTSTLHGSQRQCNISHCYFLSISRWTSFFQQYINPVSLTSFNSDHCYWIPRETLLDQIVQMEELEELSVLDSQILLKHLPQVFLSCHKITKLAVSLVGLLYHEEIDEHVEEEALENMKESFKRLTHLKLFNFEVNKLDRIRDFIFISAWSVTLEVLSWCRDCVDLKLEISYGDVDAFFEFDQNMDPFAEMRLYNFALEEQYPLLGWMSSLKSLVITRRGCHAIAKDGYVYQLVKLLFDQPSNCLEHLWVDDNCDSLSEIGYRPKLSVVEPLKSFCVGEGTCLNPRSIEVNDPKFHHLRNLGGFGFERLAQFPDLKYVRGSCDDQVDVDGLNQFCESHPMLESLHIDVELSDVHLIKPANNWKLLKLKNLVYHCKYPEKEILDHLVEACPNVEQLHVGSNCSSNRMENGVDFLSAIRFLNLRSLSFTGFDLLDGSFLPSILEQCKKIEILHLRGTLVPAVFFTKIGECLPLATKLRDLRLEWNNEEKLSDVLLFLKELVKCSSHLERVALCYFKYRTQVEWIAPPDFEDRVVSFALEMYHLVALCLVGFRIDPAVIQRVNEQFVQEIRPLRPPFWFYLGRDQPKGNDPTIPRIHYDGIVNPIDWFYTSPPSL